MQGLLNDQTSLYLQIAGMIENDILRGVYQAEEQVPSTNALAKTLNLNPATAAKGVNLLVSEGILYKKRGLGMFVSPGAADEIRRKRRAAFYEGFVKPLVKESRSLGLGAEEIMDMVENAIAEGEK